ncbi:hypothetical protein GUJ93_ZPchr0465g6477 [Zizania palustris]|uniref:Uncharacterized protein n=1 Tax=Zizania palustris TaxID=103762 RepID=A0A8J5QUH1_ZIZPA|nr:hypothetical protein GUJ93_ZPchr0465g6477 [Zizania palustris]KAG8042936.1 hypothetical protein GUJ93_ZPchr0465g6477 [Zizania palustris]KAG8042937.1 hypothetical protein GUJ93_ZPchr0465g6477 [Zizania palustris]
MEGFIPFIYRAVVQYRKEGQVSLGDLFFDEPSPSPSSSYFRLPGDSGRFQQPASGLFSQSSPADSGSPRRSPSLRCQVHHRRPATAAQ